MTAKGLKRRVGAKGLTNYVRPITSAEWKEYYASEETWASKNGPVIVVKPADHIPGFRVSKREENGR